MEIYVPNKRISKSALTVWKITGSIHSLCIWVLSIIGTYLFIKYDWNRWFIVLAILIAFLYSVLFIFIIPNIRWKDGDMKLGKRKLNCNMEFLLLKGRLFQ